MIRMFVDVVPSCPVIAYKSNCDVECGATEEQCLLHHVAVCTVLRRRLSLPYCLQEKKTSSLIAPGKQSFFGITLSGLLIFLVKSISSM